MLKKNIPNVFTALNLLCGCLAAYLAFENLFEAAFLMVICGAFFDLFDGFFARLLKVESTFGVEFDSMADLVTSGFVPGLIMYQLILGTGVYEFDFSFSFWDQDYNFEFAPVALVGFLVTLAAAVRLSKFNTDDSQHQEFLGLPTPATAMFLVSLPSLIEGERFSNLNASLFSMWGLVGISIVFSILMNVPLKLFSFKVSSGTLKDYGYHFVLIAISIPLLYYFGWGGVALIIVCYLLLNIIRNIFSRPKMTT